jgi:hypothetical protein
VIPTRYLTGVHAHQLGRAIPIKGSRAANAPSPEKFLNPAAPNHAQWRFVSRRGLANRSAAGIREHTGMTCSQRPPTTSVHVAAAKTLHSQIFDAFGRHFLAPFGVMIDGSCDVV